MCYSAEVWADYRWYVRAFGAKISIAHFVHLYLERSRGARVLIPKAMDAAFAEPNSADERLIADLIRDYNEQQTQALTTGLFEQRARLATAQRKLETKLTKGAVESKRIANNKIEDALEKLASLKRSELIPFDSRIFPGWYAPVMTIENGEHIIKPMRFRLRPPGVPASFDKSHDGAYCTRRDNLQSFWKRQFGSTHGLVVANAFYENVNRHDMEGRELAEGEDVQNVRLEFRPRPQQDMLLACLWAHWTGREQPDLYSFGVITDEPPTEVAAAGHNRCVVPLRAENVDRWLQPQGSSADSLQGLLDDRQRPYYAFKMAA